MALPDLWFSPCWSAVGGLLWGPLQWSSLSAAHYFHRWCHFPQSVLGRRQQLHAGWVSPAPYIIPDWEMPPSPYFLPTFSPTKTKGLWLWRSLWHHFLCLTMYYLFNMLMDLFTSEESWLLLRQKQWVSVSSERSKRETCLRDARLRLDSRSLDRSKTTGQDF